MDRIWQWAWDRYACRYSWAICAIAFLPLLQTYLASSFLVVAFEDSDRYIEVTGVTAVAVLVLVYVLILPGLGEKRLVEQWAAGHEIDRAAALDATYTYARDMVARIVVGIAVWGAVLLVVVGAIAGASGWRLIQYGIIGAVTGTAIQLISVHSFVEAMLRPARVAIAGDTGIGDSLPRSRPTFAAWSNVAVLAVAFTFAVAGALLAAVFDRAGEGPVLWVVIGGAMTLGFAVPISVGAAFAPSLRPIRDLAAGTERVAAGDYSQRLPVVQDDDLGALAVSFNRMQAGLAERQRLQAA
ncbi:MAG: adenylate cyclase, partial [Mycobacterium sp.]|nr:adenylate cyclase [Mycobacterium sp.]